MKLSYIIPVYNVEKYLKECIDSILAQTFDDYEIILVDDASPDNCPYICDEYAERYPDIIKVIHQKNKGLAGARNSGFRQAVGEYIYFFDSDDFFISDGIAEIYNKAVEADADILQNSFILLNECDDSRIIIRSAFETDNLYNRDEIQKKVCVSTTERSTIFVWRNIYKKSFLEKNNIFFDENLRMIEDSPFNTLTFLKAERFISADKPIYAYRVRQDSLQRKKYVKDYDCIMEYQWRLRRKYYSENSDNDRLFYKDIAEFTIKTNLPVLLSNIYSNNIDGKYTFLKRIGNSEMLRKSFEDYDIKEFKSKSLDWWATFFIKKKLYPLAHFICKNILYK